MHSTLRGNIARSSRHVLPRRPCQIVLAEAGAHPFAGLPLNLRPVLRRAGQARPFCSEKKPPKGFEKFYKQSKPKATAAESAESKGAPKEKADAKADAKAEAEGQNETSSGKGNSGNSGKKPDNNPWWLPPQLDRQTAVLGAAFVAFTAYRYGTTEERQDIEITTQELMKDHLVKGHVELLQIVNRQFCRVHLRRDSGGSSAGQVFTIQLGSPEAFEHKVESVQNELGISVLDQVPVQHVHETTVANELMPFLPSLLFLVPFVIGIVAMRRGMGGMPGGGGGGGGRNMFSMGKAFPQGHKDVKSTTKFADVAGLKGAKKEVTEFVDFLKDSSKYEKLGAKIPKGGLLVGPPGTGKTLLAKAVAGEAGVPFYSMSGSDFVEMFVGVGPSRVRDLFAQARSSAPSIIFIDEIDAVGRKRNSGGNTGGGNDERENTLNQMLVEMDGFTSSTGVVVLAGTNRVDILDPALTRAGRFDRQIAIDKPDIREREEIYMVHLKGLVLGEGLTMESISKRMASLTPGFTGADIANVCNESAIFAARRNAEGVDMDDFEKATERVLGGLPKQNMMDTTQRRTVGLHESGHAVAGWFLEYADPLLKVSIVPRSNGALGFAQYLPDEVSLYSQEAILDKIAVALGGRAAEELFVGKISTGASDDLNKVTQMAYSMVSTYGMNPTLGLLSYGQGGGDRFYKPYSEETGQQIDREARLIVDQQYERVKGILTEKGELVKKMAEDLLTKETLVYNELVEILGDRPFGIKEEYKQFVTSSGNPFTSGGTKEEAPADEAPNEQATGMPVVACESATKAFGKASVF